MSPRKVILDVDTGCDDTIAILLALQSPELDVIAIGTTHGNIESDLGAENTLRVLEWMGRQHIPVAIGAAEPLNQPLSTARFVHGEDGMGNLFLPPPQTRPTGEHAADQLVRLARQYPGEITLIAVGPLTNLALALAKEPGLPQLIKEVIIMGGSAKYGGNLSAWGEANIAHDPEAAAAVFNAPWPVTMIGLDVTMQAWFPRTLHDQLGQSDRPAAQLAYKVLKHYIGFYESVTGDSGCAQHDALAVAVAIDPTLVHAPLLPAWVETRGDHTRGMTVVDVRAARMPNYFKDRSGWHVKVALEVDAERFMRLLMERLCA